MLLSVSPKEQTKQTFTPVVEMLKEYVDNYFSESPSLERIAEIYHYNCKYLGRLFKKETGISFKTYLNQKRLEYAALLLREGKDSITDIALKSGFNNVTYFNKVFHKAYNMAPMQYKKAF